MKKVIENSQEFLQEWEKKNNPFYPNEMRWDRVEINRMLAEYEAQRNNANVLLVKEKFSVTKDEFMKPYRTKVAMNDIVAEDLKAKGISEEGINDYLQMIDEE
jgi:hypothetical protein